MPIYNLLNCQRLSPIKEILIRVRLIFIICKNFDLFLVQVFDQDFLKTFEKL